MRPYWGLPEADCPLHEHTVTVSACCRICLGSGKVKLGQVFAGQRVGVRKEDDGTRKVSSMHCEAGYFDLDTCRLEPVDNPYGPKALTMSSV